MDSKDVIPGSSGIFKELEGFLDKEEINNSTNVEKNNSRNLEINNSVIEEDTKVKTGYRLYKSALNKLEEMQMFMYPRTESGKKVSIETIINDAISYWYEVKKNEGK